MDLQIQNSLLHVANRFRLVRMGWLLAAFWLCLAMLFLWRGFSDAAAFGWLGYAWITSPLWVALIWVITRATYRDTKWVATRVESRFPDLKQRLITVASPPCESDSKFLRRSLVRETIMHGRNHDWRATVSAGRIMGAWFAQLLCLFLALSASVYSSSQRHSPSATANPDQLLALSLAPSLSVDPGDTEIERGTDLVVTARFGGGVPREVWLVTSGAASSSEVSGSDFTRSSMQPSLSDPIFGGYIRRVANDTEYRIESERGLSETYRIKVFDYPALVRSDAEIDPPAYANQEKKLVQDTKRVSVPEGSRLTWICRVNKPLETAELVDQDNTILPLIPTASDPLTYTASVEVFESRRWKVRLQDSDGRQAKVEESLSARVIANKEPEIRLSAGGDLQVSPLQEVLLQATVRDDFQLARTGVTVILGEADPIEVELQPTKQAKGGGYDIAYMVDLESMNAEPDQLLSYYFWAEDTDTNNQIRRVDGEMFFAEVRPFEEIFREGESPSQSQQQQQQQQSEQQSQNGQRAEELAELQKKIIAGTWNILRRESKPELSKSFTADVKVLEESQETALSQTEELEERIQDETSRRYLDETRQQMTTAKEQLAKSSSESSLEALRAALNAERKAYEGLLRLRAREHSIVRSQQRQNSQRNQSSAQQSRQQQLEQLNLENEKNDYESEQSAAPEQTDSQREARQVMNRLDELARRQKDLNQQIKEAETALREAKDEATKEEIEEQLARLREDQEEMIRDADELLERMNQEENRQSMQEAREQVEQAREQLQKAAESLANNQTSQAVNSGARAEQTMKEVREQIRQESSDQLQESMQNMVQKARELERNQRDLENDIARRNPSSPNRSNSNQPNANDRSESDPINASEQLDRESESGLGDLDDASPLRPEGVNEASPARDRWRAQREKMDELLEEMKNTVAEAESSEPLVADSLYDGFREAKQSGIDRQLEQIPMLLDRGFDNRAQQLAEEAGQGISKLKERIEKAAESVLGSEQESLRRALREIDRANQQLREEMESQSPGSTGENRGEARDRNGSGERDSDQERDPQETNESQSGSQSRETGESQQNQGDRQSGRGRQSAGEESSEQTRGERGEGQQEATEEEQREGAERGERQEQGQQRQQGRGQRQSSDDQPSGGRGGLRPEDDNEARERAGDETMPSLSTFRGGGQERAGNLRPATPLTGEDYRAWIDSLRDVEELLIDPERRADVARIREAAREMRVEYKRHAKEPQWDLVRKLIADPLQQLRQEVNEDLMRLAAERNALVPIDRDPVPSQYQRRLDRYYENLGRGNQKQ
ncbi:hypothetical protein SH449x_001476 [Pirellulaceae bacterium SH449]